MVIWVIFVWVLESYVCDLVGSSVGFCSGLSVEACLCEFFGYPYCGLRILYLGSGLSLCLGIVGAQPHNTAT